MCSSHVRVSRTTRKVRGSLLDINIFYQKPMEIVLARLLMIGSTKELEMQAL